MNRTECEAEENVSVSSIESGKAEGYSSNAVQADSTESTDLKGRNTDTHKQVHGEKKKHTCLHDRLIRSDGKCMNHILPTDACSHITCLINPGKVCLVRLTVLLSLENSRLKGYFSLLVKLFAQLIVVKIW